MSPGEPKQRQRVSIACQTCRAKRMRCDGQEPICSSCARKGNECVYQHVENKRRPPSKKYVEALQSRIRHLESELARLSNSQIPTFSSSILPDEDREVGSSDDGDGDGDGGSEQDPLSELSGLVGRLAVVDDGQIHYFGSQSSFNLPREPIRTAEAQHLPRMRTEAQGLAAASQLGMFVDVSPELQQHLLDLYWRWQNPWNYIVHKSAFLKSWRCEDDGRHCSPLLLSSMNAIAARYSDRVELRSVVDDSGTAGNAFCEQAKILLLYESEAPSVTTVQAAAILALRIMSDGKEALGWLYCGNATRMAHNLGLHVDCTDSVNAGLITEAEAEIRKVTWWGCLVVDKLFACGLGRPSSIHKSAITCPKPKTTGEDEYSPWLPDPSEVAKHNSLYPHSHISSTARYVSDCILIACGALEMIYAPNSQLSRLEVGDIASKASLGMRAYYNTLPSSIRLPASPKVPALPHVYLSHIQYHTHFILLHRPLIKKKRRGSVVSSISSEEPIIDRHMEICRHSAAEVSKLLRLYKVHHALRHMPIAGVHLSFASAVIHLIDCGPHNPNRKCAAGYLETCLDALQDLREPWCAWADRSLRGVQQLARNWYHCDISQLQQVKTNGESTFHNLRKLTPSILTVYAQDIDVSNRNRLSDLGSVYLDSTIPVFNTEDVVSTDIAPVDETAGMQDWFPNYGLFDPWAVDLNLEPFNWVPGEL